MQYDAVIVGSGFGGAMVAHRLVAAGARVLMIERGDWVQRDAAWETPAELSPSYARDIPYRCVRGGHGKLIGAYACVGGPSVYYGGVSLRFREQDFVGDPQIVRDSGAAWPFRYADLEPYYGEAEALLDVAGDDTGDPTAPRRSRPFPQRPAALAPITERVIEAAVAIGASPFHLPLAVNNRACVACRTCDAYACAIGAKNDLATRMIAPLVRRGMTLWTNAIAVRLEAVRDRVARLHVHGRGSVEARIFVLAAGALGTPHLLLASQLGAPALGHYLVRHANAMVFGVFAEPPDPAQRFHKQVALHDWYFGDGDGDDGLAKLGGIQQVMTPPRALVRAHLPRGTRTLVSAFTERLTGLLCIAEDQPRQTNGVGVDWRVRDRYGLPQLVIDHAYSDRDERALRALATRARMVLTRMGAVATYTHRVKTFSHALGTVRMGPADTAPLDASCRFRGLANLWITDGSALPMAAGVNPSLTIAANALRASDAMLAT